ncbi:pirin family protein [Halosquirtibacter xylanolyticus]|uniref:pirin family protein n=1 Tax=Halosquirtibacter xylanolyticus TaxID=3374599 RepID=UPI0037495796|nr:pirin family protein [Prolixibacteraceae bacterium]
MRQVIHRAKTRGHSNNGWLDSFHTFSFADYYHPERMRFGVLRVLNDDKVAPGKGFDKHPHDNMEIISIPLQGELEHRDSLGNVAVIREGDIQVMSAGSGIRHSEYNKSDSSDVSFLQIWIIPNQHRVAPRYDQISFKGLEKENQLVQILSPYVEDQGVWIYQDAWFYWGSFIEKTEIEYHVHKKGNGVYILVITGSISINNKTFHQRDGIGVWDQDLLTITCYPETQILLMEVPMR